MAYPGHRTVLSSDDVAAPVAYRATADSSTHTHTSAHTHTHTPGTAGSGSVGSGVGLESSPGQRHQSPERAREGGVGIAVPPVSDAVPPTVVCEHTHTRARAHTHAHTGAEPGGSSGRQLGQWAGGPAWARLWEEEHSFVLEGLTAALAAVGSQATSPTPSPLHTVAHTLTRARTPADAALEVSTALLTHCATILTSPKPGSPQAIAVSPRSTGRPESPQEQSTGCLASLFSCFAGKRTTTPNAATNAGSAPVDAKDPALDVARPSRNPHATGAARRSHTDAKVVPVGLLDGSEQESGGDPHFGGGTPDAALSTLGIGIPLETRWPASSTPKPMRTKSLLSPSKLRLDSVRQSLAITCTFGDVLLKVLGGAASLVDACFAEQRAGADAIANDLDNGTLRRPDVSLLMEGATLLDGLTGGSGSLSYASPGFGLHGSPGVGVSRALATGSHESAHQRAQTLFAALLDQPALRRLRDVATPRPDRDVFAIVVRAATVVMAVRGVAALCAVPDLTLVRIPAADLAEAVTMCVAPTQFRPSSPSPALDVSFVSSLSHFIQLHVPSAAVRRGQSKTFSHVVRVLLASMWKGDAVATPPSGGVHAAVVSAVLDSLLCVPAATETDTPAVPKLSDVMVLLDASARHLAIHGAFCAALNTARDHSTQMVTSATGGGELVRTGSRSHMRGSERGPRASDDARGNIPGMPEPVSRRLRIAVHRDAMLSGVVREGLGMTVLQSSDAVSSTTPALSVPAALACVIGGTVRILNPAFIRDGDTGALPGSRASTRDGASAQANGVGRLTIGTRRGIAAPSSVDTGASVHMRTEEGEGHGPRKEMLVGAMKDALATWSPWERGPGLLACTAGDDHVELLGERSAGSALASEFMVPMLSGAQLQMVLPGISQPFIAEVLDVRLALESGAPASHEPFPGFAKVGRLRLDAAIPRGAARDLGTCAFLLRRARTPLFRCVRASRLHVPDGANGGASKLGSTTAGSYAALGWLMGAALVNRVVLPLRISGLTANRIMCSAWAQGAEFLQRNASSPAERALQSATLKMLLESAQRHNDMVIGRPSPHRPGSWRASIVAPPFSPFVVGLTAAIEQDPTVRDTIKKTYTAPAAEFAATLSAEDVVVQQTAAAAVVVVDRSDASYATGVRTVPEVAPACRHAYAAHALQTSLIAADASHIAGLGAGFLSAIGLSGLLWLSTHGIGGVELAGLLSGDAGSDADAAADDAPGVDLSKYFRVVYDDEARDCAPLQAALWAAINGMTTAQQRKFLKFVTGVEEYPAPDTEVLRIETPFTAYGRAQQAKLLNMLPQAHSCTNTLELPNYFEALRATEDGVAEQVLAERCKDLLRNKLSQAVDLSEGYTLDSLPASVGLAPPASAPAAATEAWSKSAPAAAAAGPIRPVGRTILDDSDEPQAAIATPSRPLVAPLRSARDSGNVRPEVGVPSARGLMGSPLLPPSPGEPRGIARPSSGSVSERRAPSHRSMDSATELADLAAEVDEVLRAETRGQRRPLNPLGAMPAPHSEQLPGAVEDTITVVSTASNAPASVTTTTLRPSPGPRASPPSAFTGPRALPAYPSSNEDALVHQLLAETA